MKNIESKFKVNDFSEIKKNLRKNKIKTAKKLNQVDTYFIVKKGHLKIREINKKSFELIFYQRPNKKIAKTSNYEVIGLNKNQSKEIKRILKISLVIKNIIKKTRFLYLYKNTRIHLDNVSGLGKFIELETVLKKINNQKAKIEHKKLIKILNLNKEEKIRKSYCDFKK